MKSQITRLKVKEKGEGLLANVYAKTYYANKVGGAGGMSFLIFYKNLISLKKGGREDEEEQSKVL